MKLKNEGQSRGEKGNHGQTTSQVFWQADYTQTKLFYSWNFYVFLLVAFSFAFMLLKEKTK